MSLLKVTKSEPVTLLSSVITTVQQVQTVRREAFVKENTFGQHVGADAMFIWMKREFRFCIIIFCKMPPGSSCWAKGFLYCRYLDEQATGFIWCQDRVVTVNGGGIKNMWYIYGRLWASIACPVVGPSASCWEEQSYNMQRAELEPSVENNEVKCPLQPVCAFMLEFMIL